MPYWGEGQLMAVSSDTVLAPRLRATAETRIAIVCVFYEAEGELCALLADSLARFVNPDLVSEIVVLNNARDTARGQAIFAAEIAPRLARCGLPVRCLDPGDLGLPVFGANQGYMAQQVLKLEVARHLAAPFYLLFDAKNHLLRALHREDVFAADGRPRSHWSRFGGYLQTCLRESLAVFGLAPADGASYLPTVTPYLLVTDVVRAMLDGIARDRGCDLAGLLRANDRRTEFLLYCGYVLRHYGIETLYAMGPKPYATLFARWPETPEDVAAVIASAGRPEIHSFGLHVRRFARLRPEEAGQIAALWRARGLFPDLAAGLKFIHRHQQAETLASAPAPSRPAPVLDAGLTRSVTSDALPPAEDLAMAAAQDVLLGRGGRMFILNGSNRVMDQHRGLYLLPPAELAQWPVLLAERTVMAAAAGAEFGMLIAPDTHAIHREDIPEFDGTDPDRPIRQILAAVGDDLRFCYPLEALRQARDKGAVCHAADSHWTGFGAYRAYRRLLRQLPFSLEVLDRPAVEFLDGEGRGDLGDKLDPPRLGAYRDCLVRKPGARRLWDNRIVNRGWMGYWRNRRRDLPRGLLFMDSYGWQLQRFLAESFSELFIVHTPNYEPEAVAAFRPDVILSEMAERFVIRPPVMGAAPPALDSARQKNRNARYPTPAELALL